MSMRHDIAKCIEGFPQFPFQARRQLGELLDSNPEMFAGEAGAVLRDTPPGPGRRCLLTLMLSRGWAVDLIVRPYVLVWEKAVLLLKDLVSLDAAFASSLAACLRNKQTPQRTPVTAPAARRVVRLLGELPPEALPISQLMPLLLHSDGRLASKAALLIGRATKNLNWLLAQLQAEDWRVRANALEGVWGRKEPDYVAAFQAALFDDHPRVVTNALVALYEAEPEQAWTGIVENARHADARYRISTCWLLARSVDRRAEQVLLSLEQDEETAVQEAARKALAHRQPKQPEALDVEAEPVGTPA